jgi:hypothetical protein
VPPSGAPEGDEEEPPQIAPQPVVRFEAGDNPGPKPWAPIGIGLASSGIALAGVLLLGRRFRW